MSRLTLVLAVGLALVMTAPVAAADLDTPEAALREYLEGVAQADFDRVLDASAVGGLGQAYRLEEWVDDVKYFHVTGMPLGPAHSPFFADIQRHELEADVGWWARTLAYSLLAPQTLDQATLDLEPLLGVDAAWASDLLAELDESRLADLSIVDIRLPAGTGLSQYFEDPEGAARAASRLGADELAERWALVYLDGRHYAVGHLVLRFGDDWAVWKPSFRSNQTGAALPTTRAGFYELTSE